MRSNDPPSIVYALPNPLTKVPLIGEKQNILKSLRDFRMFIMSPNLSKKTGIRLFHFYVCLSICSVEQSKTKRVLTYNSSH